MQRRAGLSGSLALAGLLALGAPSPSEARPDHDPNRTVTIYVHGFSIGGAVDGGVYGADESDDVIDRIAEFMGAPVGGLPGGVLAPNAVVGTDYYGTTPPPYASAKDIADVEANTAQWGGGVPRYALIVAKYARHVMERSGARQVNFASASMGSLVVRWLIEKDVEGLAGDGKIARWLSLEGVLAGNWATSREELDELWQILGTPAIDFSHMRYQWVEANLHSPRNVADNPLLSSILIGQTGSTDDNGTFGALTAAMLLWEEYQPNDGVQGLRDAFFAEVSPLSRLAGRPPTLSLHHVNHFALVDYDAAFAQSAAFLTGRRRVTITLATAQVDDVHEPDFPFFDYTPAEVIFESRVYSPAAAARWSVSEPVSARRRDGVSAEIVLFDHDGDLRQPALVVFDDFVLDGEEALDVAFQPEELDWDYRYGVFEPLGDDAQSLSGICVTVPVTGPGNYGFSTADWSGMLSVEVFDYPFPLPGFPGDVDGDGTAGMRDVLAVLSAWGECPGVPDPCPADLDGDGRVDISDLLVVIAGWG